MSPIDKYIKNEYDIAQYHIHMLQKLKKLNPANRRLLEREMEFISIPFHSMKFNNIEEVVEAISLYRTARRQFYIKYGCSNLNKLVESFEKKLEFLLDRRDELLKSRIEELNVVQNPYFYDRLVEYEVQRGGLNRTEIKQANISSLLKIEPISLAKERARVQGILYSVGLHLEESLRKIEMPKNSFESVYFSLSKIEAITDTLGDNLFKNYNKALKLLPTRLSNTLGENDQLSKLHPIVNLIEEFPVSVSPIYKHSSFNNNIPQIGYILYGIKQAIYQTIEKDRDKKTNNKVYGILLPRERIGNEKLSLLYKKIIYDGIDIASIFSNDLSNVKAVNTLGEVNYFKAIMMHPLWKIITKIDRDAKYNTIITKIIGYDIGNLCNNTKIESAVIKINTTCTNFLDLSRDNSTILVAKTRSEEDYLQRAVEIASGRISDLYLDTAVDNSL